MERWLGDELDDPMLAARWDDAVEVTEGADPFCASSDWSFAAAVSFPETGPASLLVDGRGFCGLRRQDLTDGVALLGLDPAWGFGTPVVGDLTVVGDLVLAALDAERALGWDVAALGGQRRDLPLTRALIAALEGRHSLFQGAEEARMRADLSTGWEPWFARRSSRFRQRLRRLSADASAAGLRFEDRRSLAPVDALALALEVEGQGWKGAEGTGLATDHIRGFYEAMLGRLAPTGRVRLLVAVLDDRLVGYVLGGVRGSTYRGFQLAYASSVADLGVGHLLQLEQIKAAAAEGLTTYDLGMHMPYKDRWADRADTTFTLIVRP